VSALGNGPMLGSNNFFENIQFRGEINNSLRNVDPSMGTVQIRAALDSVDMRNLSTQEKNTLLAAVDVLGADGHISAREADVITGMIDRFESTGQLFDTLTGGNFGSFNGSQSFLPFTPASLSQFPGSALFGNVLGSIIDTAVQTFKDTLFTSTANAMLDGCAKSTYGNDKVAAALENADLSKCSPAERAKILSMIGFATSDGRVSLTEARAICQYIDEAQGKNCGCAKGEWTVDQRSNGTATIDLGNYTLDLKEGNSEFVVTNKETGEKTRIWGDPHFEHNGSHVGDFYGTTTLNLADGTKITINTTPFEAGGNGTTLSSTLTITQGDRAMRITGLDQNKLGDLNIQQVNGFGRLVDAAVDDGVQLYENPEDGPWLRLNAGGWMQAIDGDFLSKIV
jgi:uncharacterized membrane protein YebE (DUF533 family)